MIGDIESAFLPGIVALALPMTEVHRGTEWKTLPHERAVVIVDCSALQHVTPVLWNGTTIVRLSSPALKKDLVGHDAKMASLAAFLKNRAAVIATFSSPSFALCGLFVTSIRSFEEENRWIGEIECACGIQEI